MYTSSVDIRPEWAVKEQIPFTALAKLTCAPPEVSDLAFHGSLRYYDKVSRRRNHARHGGGDKERPALSVTLARPPGCAAWWRCCLYLGRLPLR